MVGMVEDCCHGGRLTRSWWKVDKAIVEGCHHIVLSRLYKVAMVKGCQGYSGRWMEAIEGGNAKIERCEGGKKEREKLGGKRGYL